MGTVKLPALTQKEIWENWTPPETLEDCVNLLFEILDTEEISEEGRKFRPTVINSCRIWDGHRLNKLLPKMKELSKIVTSTKIMSTEFPRLKKIENDPDFNT